MRDYEKYLVPGNIVVTGEAKHGIILANGVVVYLDINGYDKVSSLIEAEEGYVLKVFSPTEYIKNTQCIINEEYLDLVYEYKPGISMELKDTVEMMGSSDYKERFRAEYFQLKIRMSGLSKMLIKYKEGTLNFTPSCSYDLLSRQLKSMGLYATYLEERADIEGINLYN